MIITTKTSAEELKKRYDVLIGWGAGRDEYVRKYNPCLFAMDYMIDMDKRLEGKVICGMKISDIGILEKLTDKYVCFIVFPNIEKVVEQEAAKYIKNYDIIVSSLIDKWGGGYFCSESGEDLLFLQLADRLKLEDPTYLDIGVCHPVIRNNTYALYERGYKKGVLVEPNPDMCELIKKYRPENVLLNIGACADESQVLKYYISSNPSWVGHNTFDKTEAEACGFTEYRDISVDNVNHIIEKYCNGTVDILDIDTEGMDLRLIGVLDTEKYNIKIICTETLICGDDLIGKILEGKGYVHFASSRANGIYVKKELVESIYCDR